MMTASEFGITQFVRGMAWHDAGKPFIIDTGKHAPLGYWLLRLTGHLNEALVALAHGNSSRHRTLRAYFELGGEPLPAILSLCNSLDRLSASVYSFQDHPPETDFHSWQNPFSRQIMISPELGTAFAIRHQQIEEHLYTPLRESFVVSLPNTWREALAPGAIEAATALTRETIRATPLPDGQHVIKVIEKFLSHYPERTYPSVNDTSLKQHCRLSGILAFTVYRNIENKHKDWLDARITFDNNRLVLPIQNAEAAVRNCLSCSLVRVAFEGHRAIYEKAVRVDDLHGARELTDRTREAFKQALAYELGVHELAEFLTISESQFDLIYLLPPGQEPLAAIVQRAYEAAVGQVVGQVAEQMKRDFPQIGKQRSELWQQLGNIGYGLRIIAIEPQEEKQRFNEFAAEYGTLLLRAYQDSQKYAAFPAANMLGSSNQRDSLTPLSAAETCQVCGNYRVLTVPDNLSDEDKHKWQEQLDYAGHIFRGKRERICLSCVARRALASGAIAKRIDAIIHPMFQPVVSESRAWQIMQPANGPALPPLAPHAVCLTDDNQMIDLDAFYIRYRRRGEAIDRSGLDIFPTTGYAADATGNVILLALQPARAALFATYPYDEPIQVDQQALGTSATHKLWQDTFVAFYKKIQNGDAPQSAEPILHVHPHLARVMERIQHISVFYEDVYRRLALAETSSLCVLPLDTEYPTLRLLLPADQLGEALRRLDQAMAETLLSACPDEDRESLHGLLKLLVPDLLHGGVVLFKHKYPLYLALEAERDLFRQLQTSDPCDDRDKRTRPGNTKWYGLRLAFTDLRGTLSQAGPKLAEVTYADLDSVVRLARDVDRRTVLARAGVAEHISSELAEALTVIRAKNVGMGKEETKLLNNKTIFPSVLFVKRAMRE